jgi:hypothetical protein
MAILTPSPKGTILYYTLSVRLPDGGMTRFAGDVEMGPFKDKAGIPIVVEAIRCPLCRRTMTAIAAAIVLFPELAAVNILMTRSAGG